MGFKRTLYGFIRTAYGSATNWAETPATSRHTRRLLWLLPSGPDQVHKLALREDQGLHRFGVFSDCRKRG
ncbi:hypothetical protein VQ7734_01832 [Vibrio quintilis]|uniref:Uncharacterized protein n=1 Tax=Vibrio quintilis TaxID=1117707 RepID=A0A1M7YTX5_9VIBR|nr:hypothetical protein VQ7734_01832 [Vibrio quintilis]